MAKAFTKNIVLSMTLYLFLVAACIPVVVHADSVSAGEAISTAKSKFVESFTAAKAAESAGANISDLTESLNGAGVLLSKAESLYSSGNFQGAESLAILSQNNLNTFISEAKSLESAALQTRNMDFLINIVGSITGTVAVVIGSISIWVLLKLRYERAGGR
jgi:hypothetical protein